MNKVGLHLRITDSIVSCLKQAIAFDLPCFQCFFIDQHNKQYIRLSNAAIREFLALKQRYNKPIFAHLSYWMNLARAELNGDMKRLRHEVRIAKKLGITYLVMHPGHMSDGIARQKAVDLIVERLDKLFKEEHDCTILLENIALGSKGIGCSIEELAAIRQQSNFPERIQFCIDTAHAFTYGYRLNCQLQRESFVALLDKKLGLNNIKLLHVNDTLDECGSNRDRHAIVGQGRLGKKALAEFITHPRLKMIPRLMELPPLDPHQQLAILEDVNTW